jgi:hypothetical protein
MAQAAEAPSKKLVLNFKGVQFMSSAMIGKLVLLNKKAKADEIHLKLCDISPNVLEVFKITRLNKVLTSSRPKRKLSSPSIRRAGSARRVERRMRLALAAKCRCRRLTSPCRIRGLAPNSPCSPR